MKPSEYFPRYGNMRTPPKSRVKVGSRRLFLDVDPSVYYFIARVVVDINNGRTVDLATEWKKELAMNKNLVVGKRHIYKVFSKKTWHTSASQVEYSVNWDLLLRHLETKSKDMIRTLKRNPNVGLGILYDELASNYMKLKGLQNSFPDAKDTAKQTLGIRQTNDWKEIEESLTGISELSNEIEVRFPTDSFFELSSRLYRYARVLDFNGLYYTVREMMDRLFPILFIHAVAKKESLNNRYLSFYYLLYLNYTLKEYWRSGGSKPRKINLENSTFDQISKEFVKPIARHELFNSDGSPNFDRWKEALDDDKFRLPLIDVDSKGFSVLTKVLDIEPKDVGDLKRLYEVCSSSVHNLLSFPFRFFLEIKVAKHFLDWYEKELRNVLRELNIPGQIQRQGGAQVPQKYNHSLKKLIEFYQLHSTDLSSIISEQVHENSWEFEALKSFYRIYQPGVSRLRRGSVNYPDFKEALVEIERISYGTGIWLAETNLEKLGYTIIEKIREAGITNLPDKFTSEEIGFVCTYIYFEYTNSQDVVCDENRDTIENLQL